MSLINSRIWCAIGTKYGSFRMFQNDTNREDYCLLSYGSLHELPEAPLVRIQSSCLASEVFGSIDCDCKDQLELAMKRIAAAESGLVIFLRQEGRGQGLSRKIQAMRLSDLYGYDTFDAYRVLGIEQDTRTYHLAASIILELEKASVRLMTNNYRKVEGLMSCGINVVDVIPHVCPMRPEIRPYLWAKETKLGHRIGLVEDERQ